MDGQYDASSSRFLTNDIKETISQDKDKERMLLKVLPMMLAISVSGLPQQTTYQPIGNGFVGGVNVPQPAGGPGAPLTANAQGLNANVGTAGAAAGTLAPGTPGASVGQAALNLGAAGLGLGNSIGSGVMTGLAGGNNVQAALGQGGAGVDLGAGQLGASAAAAYLPVGRSQVVPTQRFGIAARMTVQVTEGELLCAAGTAQGDFLLKTGQGYRFRGASSAAAVAEGCVAQRPTVVVAALY